MIPAGKYARNIHAHRILTGVFPILFNERILDIEWLGDLVDNVSHAMIQPAMSDAHTSTAHCIDGKADPIRIRKERGIEDRRSISENYGWMVCC